MTNKSKHIYHLRKMLMNTLAFYAGQHENVDDTHLMGAISAVLCDALIVKGVPFDDDLIDTLRKTYTVCEIQHAMTDKKNNSVQ